MAGALNQLPAKAKQPLTEATHAVAGALAAPATPAPAASDLTQAAAATPAVAANVAAKLAGERPTTPERPTTRVEPPAAPTLDRVASTLDHVASGPSSDARLATPPPIAAPLLGRVTQTVASVGRAAAVPPGVLHTARGLVAAPARTALPGASHLAHARPHAAQSSGRSLYPPLDEAASLVHRQLRTVVAPTTRLHATVLRALPATSSSLASPPPGSLTGARLARVSLVQPELEASTPTTPGSSLSATELVRGEAPRLLDSQLPTRSGVPESRSPVDAPTSASSPAPSPSPSPSPGGGLLPVAAGSGSAGASVALMLALSALLLAAWRPALRRLRPASESLRAAQFLLIPERPG